MLTLSPWLMLLATSALADDPDAFAVEGASIVEEALPSEAAPADAAATAPVDHPVETTEDLVAEEVAPMAEERPTELTPPALTAAPAPQPEPEPEPERPSTPVPADSEPPPLALTPTPPVAPTPPTPPVAPTPPTPPVAPTTPTPPVAPTPPTPPASPETIAAHLGAAGRMVADRAREKASATSDRVQERVAKRHAAEPEAPEAAPTPPPPAPDCDCDGPVTRSHTEDDERRDETRHNRHRRRDRHRQWYVGTDIHATTLAGTPSLMRGIEGGTVGKRGLVIGLEGLSGERMLEDGRHIGLESGGVRLGWAFRSHRQLGLRFDTLIGTTMLTDVARDRSVGALQTFSPRVSIDYKPLPWLQISPNLGNRHLVGLGTHGALSAPTVGISVRVGRF